jgi:hypothetical protein
VPLRLSFIVLCILAAGATSALGAEPNAAPTGAAPRSLAGAAPRSVAGAAPRSLAGISPGLVHRGQRTTIRVSTRTAGVSCVAALQFADLKTKILPARQSRSTGVSFTVLIPRTAAMGAGRWHVTCGIKTTWGSFVVTGVQSTTGADQPKVVVDRQGFTQRPDKTGTGSLLSYGVVLRDSSAAEDAQNVYVIVNMVAGDGELIGSKSQTVELVPAAGTFALGDSLHLRTQAAVTRLEITIRVGAHEPKQEHDMPQFANIRILPSVFDPGWVSEVDAEIVNVDTPKTLASANVSLVVLDAGGNPLGGGRGYSTASLPSGSRFVFIAQNGFSSIPLDKAASVLISTEPTYTAP